MTVMTEDPSQLILDIPTDNYVILYNNRTVLGMSMFVMIDVHQCLFKK